MCYYVVVLRWAGPLVEILLRATKISPCQIIKLQCHFRHEPRLWYEVKPCNCPDNFLLWSRKLRYKINNNGFCFHWTILTSIKLEKSGNTVKTPHLGFSLLKMQAVFTSKNKGFSCLYEQKFTKSYTTSWDGITCPDKHRGQSGHA